jgi:hypothetical protein
MELLEKNAAAKANAKPAPDAKKDAGKQRPQVRMRRIARAEIRAASYREQALTHGPRRLQSLGVLPILPISAPLARAVSLQGLPVRSHLS